jgi:hypothetical protein
LLESAIFLAEVSAKAGMATARSVAEASNIVLVFMSLSLGVLHAWQR